MNMVYHGDDMRGVFTQLLFTYSPSLQEGLDIIFRPYITPLGKVPSPSTITVPHFKLGLPTGKHHQIHFIMKPRFWERYDDYSEVWSAYANSETLLSQLAQSYTFHTNKHKPAPSSRKVYGWSKFHMKIESDVWLTDIDAVIITKEVLDVAEENPTFVRMLNHVQTSIMVVKDVPNPFQEKLYFVNSPQEAEKVYMERLLYHGLFV